MVNSFFGNSEKDSPEVKNVVFPFRTDEKTFYKEAVEIWFYDVNYSKKEYTVDRYINRVV